MLRLLSFRQLRSPVLASKEYSYHCLVLPPEVVFRITFGDPFWGYRAKPSMNPDGFYIFYFRPFRKRAFFAGAVPITIRI